MHVTTVHIINLREATTIKRNTAGRSNESTLLYKSANDLGLHTCALKGPEKESKHVFYKQQKCSAYVQKQPEDFKIKQALKVEQYGLLNSWALGTGALKQCLLVRSAMNHRLPTVQTTNDPDVQQYIWDWCDKIHPEPREQYNGMCDGELAEQDSDTAGNRQAG